MADDDELTRLRSENASLKLEVSSIKGAMNTFMQDTQEKFQEIQYTQKQLLEKMNCDRPVRTTALDGLPSVPEGGPPHTLLPNFKTLDDGTISTHETKKAACAYCQTVVRSICNTCQVPFCSTITRPPKFCHFLAHEDPAALEIIVESWRIRSGWCTKREKRAKHG